MSQVRVRTLSEKSTGLGSRMPEKDDSEVEGYLCAGGVILEMEVKLFGTSNTLCRPVLLLERLRCQR